MDSEILRAAWAPLESETPLKTDCGQLCGRACCLPDEDGQGGVLLFPGEEALMRAPAWGQIVDLDDRGDGQCGKLLICDGPCDRRLRPLGCRLFPLTPARVDGAWTLRLDRRAWPVCPLMNSGMQGLNPAFLAAAKAAVARVAADREGADFWAAWEKIEALYGAW
jgi:hypothetical protein